MQTGMAQMTQDRFHSPYLLGSVNPLSIVIKHNSSGSESEKNRVQG